jgi:hypothetical protein
MAQTERNPQFVPTAEVHRLLQTGRTEEALAVAREAVTEARVCLPAHGFLASILLRLGRVEEAAHTIELAAHLPAGDGDACDGLAYVAMALGKHELANHLYRRASEVAPAEARFCYNLACSERSLGRLTEAEAACDRAVALASDQFASYLLRSELRVQTPACNHIPELKALLSAKAGDYRAQVLLGYALAKELDDIGRFDEAFTWFQSAARVRRSRLSYDVAMDEQKLRRIAEAYPRARVASQSVPDARVESVDSSRYVFIVGLPRSGTTLVERILGGLPGVRSNGETDNLSRALFGSAGQTGDVFQRAASADLRSVAANYARLAEPGVPARHILEKLPLNYLYLGAIHQALPDARIVLVSRTPLDSCFAMYRTLFAAGYPFSYDLRELGRYYAAYDTLIEHWRSALDGQIHEVVYEELVRDPVQAGRLIARHCGLEWNDAAIEIQNNQSVSLTASAAQVRRPIYGSSSGRWRHYRANLEPLIETLRQAGVTVPL